MSINFCPTSGPFTLTIYNRELAERRGVREDKSETRENTRQQKTIKQLAEEAGWREMGEYGFKKGAYWSGKNLRRMAEDIGWLERYETVYKIYSDVTHAGAASGGDYFSQSDEGATIINVGPQYMHSEACLREGYFYLATTFVVADDCVDLGLGKQLDIAVTTLPEVLPGSSNFIKDSTSS